MEQWRPCDGKKGRARSKSRGVDDLKRTAGTKIIWRELGEAYVKKWIPTG